LRHRPLLHHDEALGWTLVHAGFDPSWTLHDARSCAHEVESALRAEDCIGFLAAMYGNAPRRWDPALRGDDRLRVITNCFTRMRYCKADGALDFSAKGPLGSQPSSLRPWFMLPQRASRELRIVFGHWSTLRLSLDEQQRYRVYPLDTGAVWGGPLSALRLEDSAPFAVPSSMPAQFGQD
jgi:bis(5'-nucleosyl)-tetraphosphatase (symmetrical)